MPMLYEIDQHRTHPDEIDDLVAAGAKWADGSHTSPPSISGANPDAAPPPSFPLAQRLPNGEPFFGETRGRALEHASDLLLGLASAKNPGLVVATAQAWTAYAEALR